MLFDTNSVPGLLNLWKSYFGDIPSDLIAVKFYVKKQKGEEWNKYYTMAIGKEGKVIYTLKVYIATQLRSMKT